MNKTMMRAHAVISGKVQGVFFRAETRKAALEIGVTGWVRNKTDGTVEAIFEGDESQVVRMLEWCKTGSPYADVKGVDVDWPKYTGEFEDFRITY